MKALPFFLPLFALGACGKTAPSAEDPIQRLEGLTLRQSKSGVVHWEIESESARLTEGDKRADLVLPRASFYKKGRKASLVESLAGSARLDTNDLRLSSAVVVTALEDGTVLKTEELFYSSEKGRFHTQREVFVKRPGGNLHGEGMEATPDLSEIRIFKQRTTIEQRP